MKKNLQLAAMLIGFCVFAGNAAVCLGQNRMVGGYNAVDKTDQTDAAVAANFAVQTQSKKGASLKLISIERAERQVVAGSNYRLCLTVESKNKRREATAIVYQNLRDEFSLTSWTDGKCSGAAAAADIAEETAEADETVSYKGALEVGKSASTILYVGAESGDYAAFCFDNNSAVGRAILAACKSGEQCEFVGTVDFETACKVKGLEADLSASGKITKIESVKSLARKSGAATAKPATTTTSTAALAPDQVVKNLYAAHKAGASPFFQNEDRARVDKYFSKDFADLIWKDATTATDGVGAIDSDPLYNAQDSEITAFVVGKPQPDRQSGIATVTVSFKNFGKADSIGYLLAQDDSKNWKITDMRFQNGDMLKGILTAAQNEGAPRGEFEGNYTVGATTCAVKPIKMAFEVKCGNQKQAKIYIFDGNANDQPMFTAENAGSFIFDDESLSNGIFIDAAGKKVKVRRAQ